MSRIEQDLAALGAELEWPSVDDLSASVQDRLASRMPPRQLRSRRRWLLAVAVLAIVSGALLAAPGTRSALLRFLHIGGIAVERVAEPPPSGLADRLGPFGGRITAGEASSILGADLRPPASSLGRPDQIRGRRRPTPQVTYVWLRDGRPDLVVTQFRARVDPFAVKQLSGEVRVDYAGYGDGFALWIQGARHVFVPAGEAVIEAGRLSGNTLIVAEGRRTLRVEGATTRLEALRVIRQLEG